jgi:glycosyltransferase involved in cell wall biosynthesis
MRILFAGKQHFHVGGVETSTDQLARRLLARGHVVAAMAAPRIDDPAGASRIEEVPGYEYPAFAVHRMAPAKALAEIRSRFAPDVVVVNAGGRWWHDWTRPLVAGCRDLPCVLYVCDREAVELLAGGSVRPDVVWTVADSHTAAARAVCEFHVITVPSLVEPDLYRTEPTGEVVLYVNPVKSKGVRIAITLAAARRDIPFVFLRSWGVSDRESIELQRLAGVLGNIDVAPPTPDPREYFGRARLLLAPYDDLGRPRVIAEAQLSGIPILALDEAGNLEATGPGGLLVSGDAPIPDWIDALGVLWDNPAEHDRLAAAALAHSQRPEMDPTAIVTAVEAGLADAVDRFHRRVDRRPQQLPMVSVVVPVHNGADLIGDQLEGLARQTYAGPWELIVSDNGSTDGTRGRVVSWEGRIPGELRIVDSSERAGAAYARNVAVRVATGDYILFCDADDVVAPDWIERMVEALHNHEIVAGLEELRMFNHPDQYEWMGEVEPADLAAQYRFRIIFSTNNLGARREVVLALGGFDETFLRAEDTDWSWRAQYAGYDVWFEPSAIVHVRLRSNLRAVATRWFRGGVSEPLLYVHHKERGMEAERLGDVAREWWWLARNARAALREPETQHRWTAKAAERAGRLVGSVRHRTVFL